MFNNPGIEVRKKLPQTSGSSFPPTATTTNKFLQSSIIFYYWLKGNFLARVFHKNSQINWFYIVFLLEYICTILIFIILK